MFSNFLIIVFHLMNGPQSYFHSYMMLVSSFVHCRKSPNKKEISVLVIKPSCILKVASHNLKNVQFHMENFFQPIHICIDCPSSKSQNEVLIYNLFWHEIECNICFAHVSPFYPFCSLP